MQLKILFDTQYINAPKTEGELASTKSFIEFLGKPLRNKKHSDKDTLQYINQCISGLLHLKAKDKKYDSPFDAKDTAEISRSDGYWVFNETNPYKDNPNNLTTNAFKQHLSQQGYTADEKLQSYILKLLLQNRIGIHIELSMCILEWLGSLVNGPIPAPADTTQATLEKENDGKLKLRIVSPYNYGAQKIPFAQSNATLIIHPDCSIHLEALSIDITPTKENQEACQKIRAAYQAGMETNRKLQAKIISSFNYFFNKLTRWPGLVLFLLIFMILSATGVFSPLAFITTSLEFNAVLTLLMNTLLGAIPGIVAWGSTVALKAVITHVKELRAKESKTEELFVKHVPVTIPAEAAVPAIVGPQTLLGETPRLVPEPSPRIEDPSRESPTPSTSGDEGSGHNSDEDNTVINETKDGSSSASGDDSGDEALPLRAITRKGSLGDEVVTTAEQLAAIINTSKSPFAAPKEDGKKEESAQFLTPPHPGPLPQGGEGMKYL